MASTRTRIIGPHDGEAGRLGSIGVRFMIDGAESGGGFSLVELTPRTGRTHQLRLHMAALGCPLAGDWLYGTENPDLIARPALHAVRLELTHPVTGKPLTFAAPLPKDMIIVLERFVCPS